MNTPAQGPGQPAISHQACLSPKPALLGSTGPQSPQGLCGDLAMGWVVLALLNSSQTHPALETGAGEDGPAWAKGRA